MVLDAQPLPADTGAWRLDPHRGVECVGPVFGSFLLLGDRGALYLPGRHGIFDDARDVGALC